VEPFGSDALFRPQDPEGQHFLHFIESWTRLTAALNELSRAMGYNDFYPFVLSRSTVAKLHFVHLVVGEAGGRRSVEPVPCGRIGRRLSELAQVSDLAGPSVPSEGSRQKPYIVEI
jgi:Putative zinc-binding metallo-peptidase